MIILRNQPVRFYEEGTRGCGYPLRFESGDQYQFQLYTQDVYLDYTNWLTNGDFSSATGWAMTTSGMVISGGSLNGTTTAAGNISNDYRLLNGHTYRITFSITTNTGIITCFGKTNRSEGTWEVVYKSPLSVGETSTPYEQFVFSLAYNGTYEITNIEVADITDNYSFVCYVSEMDGTHLGTLSEGEPSEKHVTYDADIGSYSPVNGTKYLIKVLDPASNTGYQNFVRNGLFTHKSDSTEYSWTESTSGGNDFTVQTNATEYTHELDWTSDTLTAGDSISQDGVLEIGTEYQISFNVSAISNATITVFAGTASSAVTTTGGKNITLTCAGNTTLSFAFSNSLAGANAVIDTITISKTTESDFLPDYESNLFLYTTESNCSHMVRCFSESDVLGLSMASFIPSIRVWGDFEEPEYTEDAQEYTNSANRRSVYSYTGRKSWLFTTDLAHEYVHDFLRLLPAFDNFYIDGVEYAREDGQYQVRWEMLGMGVGQMRLGYKEQKSFAYDMNPGSTGIDVASSGDFLVDPSGNFIVDPSGNFIITP